METESLCTMYLCDYYWMCRNNSQNNHHWWFFSSSICDPNTSYVIRLAIDRPLRQSKPFQSVIQQWDFAVIRPVYNRSVFIHKWNFPRFAAAISIKNKAQSVAAQLGEILDLQIGLRTGQFIIPDRRQTCVGSCKIPSETQTCRVTR